MEKIIKYEGIIEYFKLSDETHKGPYLNSKNIPVILVGIKNEQERLKEFELPINIPNDPFSIKLIEREMKGQKATYESRYRDATNEFYGSIWNFQINSGLFKGTAYTLKELID